MPKETRIDKIELEKRIRIVQEWIIDDWSYSDIVTNIRTKWQPYLIRRQSATSKMAREKWVDRRAGGGRA
jgi:hypothetical protein